MKYYKLIDEMNFGEIVKDDNGMCYLYCFGAEKWIRSTIMVTYNWPDDAKYGLYMVINEKKAEELKNQQREQLNSLLELAQEVARQAHKGQLDKGGHPYIAHPRVVANSLESTEHKIVALLHDVCEDTTITTNELLNLGFTKRIVNSISIITKTKNVSYDDYLAKVKQDSNAWNVKMADIKHNMELSRISNPTEKDFARIDKYKKALYFLEN